MGACDGVRVSVCVCVCVRARACVRECECLRGSLRGGAPEVGGGGGSCRLHGLGEARGVDRPLRRNHGGQNGGQKADAQPRPGGAY